MCATALWIAAEVQSWVDEIANLVLAAVHKSFNSVVVKDVSCRIVETDVSLPVSSSNPGSTLGRGSRSNGSGSSAVVDGW